MYRVTFELTGGGTSPRTGSIWKGGRRYRTLGSMALLRDLWAYMRERKKLWLAPLLVIFLVVGGLIAATAGSALAPFIYSIF